MRLLSRHHDENYHSGYLRSATEIKSRILSKTRDSPFGKPFETQDRIRDCYCTVSATIALWSIGAEPRLTRCEMIRDTPIGWAASDCRSDISFALWKDADPDIPILKQAKVEYEKLK